ncbi:hypothetical protein [Rhodoferax sp.]|uniref:hypothetical protein n=1 Tax=Rhodoferax sp. TaxID=50421 RepID=UPI00275C58ED|nr:hypothetical protein [Rhodoferax sp.]
MGKEKKAWVQLKVLLEPSDHQKISDAAHAARLPVGVFAREFLTTGVVPKVAPPAISELSFEAQELLKVTHACVSNFSQLHGFAAEAGEPLSRLAGQGGALMHMSSRAREIGMQIKSGMLAEPETVRLLTALAAPSSLLNGLARALNSDQQPALAVWRQTLSALQSALLPGQSPDPEDPEERRQ